MNSTIVWVLSFTVLGVTPEHGSIAKFPNRQECEQALKAKKEEAVLSKKTLSGSCTVRLTAAQK